METVPIYMKQKIENDPKELLHYCTDMLELTQPDIRMRKIKIQSLIKKDGYFLYISGKTGNRIALRNAVNLCLQEKWIFYVKKLDKYAEFNQIDEEISKEKNQELYQLLLEKHIESIYAKRPNPVGDKLFKAKERFCSLELSEQCDALIQIIKLSSIGAAYADLSMLKEAPKCGEMKMPKKINGAKELILINQSVTGIYENSIDLLTV